jgi:hypothetical protein
MAKVEAKALSETAVRNLEDRIPELAASATVQAYYRALSSGLTVYCVQGNNIVESNAEGTVRIVAPAKPRTKVTLGKVHHVRRVKIIA